MVVAGGARLPALGLLLLFILAPIEAETRLSAGIDVYESALRRAPDDWRLVSSGTGSISIVATGSRNVRGELALSLPLSATPALAVDRAYVRFRLPWFRVTAGTTALSWGEGLLLNAGDLPNPGYDPRGDLVAGDFRSAGIWQAELFVPLGPLSFVEAVVLPQIVALPALPEFGDARIGGRVYIDAGVLALQTGYLYDAPIHRIYGSLQGHLGIELYAAIAHELEQNTETVAQDLLSSFVLSAGGFHTVSLRRDRSLSLRIETRIKPTDVDAGLPDGASIGTLVDLAVSPTLNLGLQSLVIPSDPSALVSGTVGWNMDQGFTIIAATSGHLGGEGTTYDSSAVGSPTITLGVRYSF